VSAALPALAAVTFAFGIAAGNGPRFLTIARGAASAWQPHRTPNPFTQLMEGTSIMSASSDSGQGAPLPPADLDPSDDGNYADVLFLPTADDETPADDGAGGRGGRPPAARPASGDDEPEDDGPGDDDTDHESVLVGQVVAGPGVDPPDEPRGSRPRGARDRRPVIPPGLRSWAAVARSLRWAAGEAGYHAGFHAVRVPKYAAKTVLYAVPGVFRIGGRLIRWATAEEGNWHLRRAAADRGDAATWLTLDARRQRQSTGRWVILLTGTAAGAVAGIVLAFAPLPYLPLWQGLAVSATVAISARAGRPADKPITDRVSQGKAYRKLTAELVRRALLSVQLSGINSAVAKDPGAISFPQEIHRDGPGHLALVDLPYGVEAADVIARRGRLASGLRLPLDQVWPEPAPGHTGRLALWVGHEPASQMRQPAWPLLRGGTVDVFKPFAFATTPRLDVTDAAIAFRNWLFGGQPGSGKSWAMRLIVLAAALDVRVELRGYELKGVGDFAHVGPVCAEYGNGNDDETLQACADMFGWLYGEGQKRAKRIAHYASIGKARENKVTPELASMPDSGLHPLVVFVDEIQELFLFGKTGKAAGETAEKCIKLFRALGIWLVLGTQIPDRDSLPPGITRNINTRFCLSVADQVANDMILGTSAYKLGYRATVFEPVTEAGWGILAGIGKPGARRSFAIDNDQAARVMARATDLRAAAGVLPDHADGPARPLADVLADVAAVWPAGEDAAWNETLLERLATLRPEVYGRWEPAQLTAALSGYGVTVGQIGRRIDGKTVNRRGPARADIIRAVTDRSQNRSGA
jgi:DNA segregation ATPase FtsK/SpoIIIE, S-DNA-T family